MYIKKMNNNEYNVSNNMERVEKKNFKEKEEKKSNVKEKREKVMSKRRRKKVMSGVGFEPTPTRVDCDLNAAP